MNENSFENYPGENINREPSEEDLARADQWESAMEAEDTPAFAGEDPMVPMGLELTPSETEEVPEEAKNNESLSSAAAIINYGLNAAAREYGVETVVQKIKTFNSAGSENPIKDLFLYLGIDTPSEFNDVQSEGDAMRAEETNFYDNSEAAPDTKRRSIEGAFQAIQDMKNLIAEVEGTNPRYEELREGAKAAGKGYFEYAVGSNVNRGLTDLFNTLAAEPKTEEAPKETSEEAPEKAEEDPERVQ